MWATQVRRNSTTARQSGRKPRAAVGQRSSPILMPTPQPRSTAKASSSVSSSPRYTGSTPVGCAALKALDDTRCEMKRLYVRPEYRGQGIARALVHQLMQEARVAGYRQMVLDTFPFLPEAITLYKREGFYEIERYNDNPMPGSVYLCCEL